MIDNGYLFSRDNKRIFINTSLGCSGQCTYCYLPKIGYSNNKNNYKTITAKTIIEFIENNSININKNTLITLGCYSECWDEYNKNETINLIKYFLKKGNQIQLSTKKQIMKNELVEILPLVKYYGQLVFFISLATISKHDTIEKNTTSILDRFQNFTLLNTLNIPAVLYMKPVLEGITINDLEVYKKYIKKYEIKDVVVGSIFTNCKSEETVHFSNRNELFYTKNRDEDIIISELSKITNVYKRSSEVMCKYDINYYIEKLKPYVIDLFKDDSSGHDISHLERTKNTALYLQEKEGGDRIIIGIAAFLHDVHRIMQNESGKFVSPKDSIEKIKEILSHVDLTKEKIDKICYAIEYHEEYNWNGKNVDDISTLIVQDADNLDAIGAIGIGRTFAFGGAHNTVMYDDKIPLNKNDDYSESNSDDPSTIHHFYHKLFKLGDNMNTKTAKDLAIKRTEFMKSFVKEFLDEWNANY